MIMITITITMRKIATITAIIKITGDYDATTYRAIYSDYKNGNYMMKRWKKHDRYLS